MASGYKILHMFLRFFFSVVFRWKTMGIENIPVQGGVIIAANHISLWDPPVVGSAIFRPVHFMAKEELFSIPVFSWIITRLNAFPVRRGSADRGAIRKAITLLEQGEVIGLFPEGTRNKTEKLGQPEPGVAMIAHKVGVPIVPTAVIGTNKIGKNGILFPRFIVKFGKPIIVNKCKSDKETLENTGKLVMQEIARLLAEK